MKYSQKKGQCFSVFNWDTLWLNFVPSISVVKLFVTMFFWFDHSSDLKSTSSNLSESCHSAKIFRNLCYLCCLLELRMLLKTSRFEARSLSYIATLPHVFLQMEF